MSEAKAGKYELTASRWDEILSKPGEPLDFKRHRRGDVVDLDAGEAARLLRAGAVKPTGSKSGDGGEAKPAARRTDGGK